MLLNRKQLWTVCVRAEKCFLNFKSLLSLLSRFMLHSRRVVRVTYVRGRRVRTEVRAFKSRWCPATSADAKVRDIMVRDVSEHVRSPTHQITTVSLTNALRFECRKVAISSSELIYEWWPVVAGFFLSFKIIFDIFLCMIREALIRLTNNKNMKGKYEPEKLFFCPLSLPCDDLLHLRLLSKLCTNTERVYLLSDKFFRRKKSPPIAGLFPSTSRQFLSVIASRLTQFLIVSARCERSEKKISISVGNRRRLSVIKHVSYKCWWLLCDAKIEGEWVLRMKARCSMISRFSKSGLTFQFHYRWIFSLYCFTFISMEDSHQFKTRSQSKWRKKLQFCKIEAFASAERSEKEPLLMFSFRFIDITLLEGAKSWPASTLTKKEKRKFLSKNFWCARLKSRKGSVNTNIRTSSVSTACMLSPSTPSSSCDGQEMDACAITSTKMAHSPSFKPSCTSDKLQTVWGSFTTWGSFIVISNAKTFCSQHAWPRNWPTLDSRKITAKKSQPSRRNIVDLLVRKSWFCSEFRS